MPIKIRKSNKPCAFCVSKSEPAWQESEKLREFLSSRGRILPRIVTGVCQRHQKKLAKAIKQARLLGLL